MSRQALGNGVAGVLFFIVAIVDFTRDSTGIGVVFLVFTAVFLGLAFSARSGGSKSELAEEAAKRRALSAGAADARRYPRGDGRERSRDVPGGPESGPAGGRPHHRRAAAGDRRRGL